MQNKYNSSRAVQFMPFDALKGLREALKEKEVQKVSKIDLTEDSLETLQYTFSLINELTLVEITYYHNFQYYKLQGIVSKIDLEYGIINIIENQIKFDDIFEITILEE